MSFFSINEDNPQQLSDIELLYRSNRYPWYFRTLVDRYQDPFFRRAMRIINHKEDAEEIVQDTFTKIYLKADTFVEQPGASFSSWAYRILLNTTFTCYQKRLKAGQRFTFIDPEFEALIADPVMNQTQHEQHDAIERILSVIPSQFAKVLRLHYLDRWPQQDIADELGESVSTIKVRIFRAKKAFRRAQEKLDEKPVW